MVSGRCAYIDCRFVVVAGKLRPLLHADALWRAVGRGAPIAVMVRSLRGLVTTCSPNNSPHVVARARSVLCCLSSGLQRRYGYLSMAIEVRKHSRCLATAAHFSESGRRLANDAARLPALSGQWLLGRSQGR